MRTPTKVFGAFAVAMGLSALATPASANTTLNLDTDCTNWSIANKVFTCETTPTAPGAPSGCIIQAPGGTTLAASAQFTLNASCAGTTTSTQWVWSKDGVQQSTATGTSSSFAGQLATSGTYSVSVTNPNVAQAGTASIGMTVSSGTPPPPTGGGTIGDGVACSAFAHTRAMPLQWPSAANVVGYSSSLGGFGANDVLVVKIHTPPQGTNGQVGGLSIYEYQDAGTTRLAALTTSQCSFTEALTVAGGWGPRLNFSVGPNSQGALALRPDTDYFINIKNVNRDGVTNSCPVGKSCNVGVELSMP